jgi:hypothetical protein
MPARIEGQAEHGHERKRRAARPGCATPAFGLARNVQIDTSHHVDRFALHAHHGLPAKHVDARSCTAPQVGYSPEEEVAAL